MCFYFTNQFFKEEQIIFSYIFIKELILKTKKLKLLIVLVKISVASTFSEVLIFYFTIFIGEVLKESNNLRSF